eukprot:GDKJ01019771.1.p1 GENE.GDKJ01019771.1~~GDKJ01019771.1.p1  ORF type:complete len:414 (-),score=90.16 GDKJ01019771.1:63-1268(-)
MTNAILFALEENNDDLIRRLESLDDCDRDDIVSTCQALLKASDENDTEEILDILSNAEKGEISQPALLHLIQSMVKNFNYEVLECLVSKGLHFTTTTSVIDSLPVVFTQNVTPETFGAYKKCITYVVSIMKVEIDLPRKKDGATALCVGCDRGMPPVVDLLISLGAKVNFTTCRGLTPMIYAQLLHRSLVKKMLAAQDKPQMKKRGCNLSTQDLSHAKQEEVLRLNLDFESEKKKSQGFCFQVDHQSSSSKDSSAQLSSEEKGGFGISTDFSKDDRVFNPRLGQESDGLSDFNRLQGVQFVMKMLASRGVKSDGEMKIDDLDSSSTQLEKEMALSSAHVTGSVIKKKTNEVEFGLTVPQNLVNRVDEALADIERGVAERRVIVNGKSVDPSSGKARVRVCF